MFLVPMGGVSVISLDKCNIIAWVPLPLCDITYFWCCELDAKSMTVTNDELCPSELGYLASGAHSPSSTCPASGQLGL